MLNTTPLVPHPPQSQAGTQTASRDPSWTCSPRAVRLGHAVVSHRAGDVSSSCRVAPTFHADRRDGQRLVAVLGHIRRIAFDALADAHYDYNYNCYCYYCCYYYCYYYCYCYYCYCYYCYCYYCYYHAAEHGQLPQQYLLPNSSLRDGNESLATHASPDSDILERGTVAEPLDHLVRTVLL